jgi:hypothetical protein
MPNRLRGMLGTVNPASVRSVIEAQRRGVEVIDTLTLGALQVRKGGSAPPHLDFLVRIPGGPVEWLSAESLQFE